MRHTVQLRFAVLLATLGAGCHLCIDPESVPVPPPGALIYTDASFTVGQEIGQPTPPWTAGVPIDTFTSVPPLPLGLTFDGDGGIAGTPLALSPPTTYEVTASNGSGSTTGWVAVAVTAGAISGLKDLSAAGNHTCVAVNDDRLLCWGENYWGQLGVGNNASYLYPVLALGVGPDIRGASSSDYHACALGAGGVSCWGAYYGGVPDSGVWNSTPMELVASGSGAVSIAAGANHTCFVAAGRVSCWGANGVGQLGDGTPAWRDAIAPVPDLSDVSMVVAGYAHTCALTDGGVWCWGSNVSGQVGDSLDSSPHLRPYAVTRLPSGVQAIAAGTDHTCALADGGAYCWGSNQHNELGSGVIETFTAMPRAVRSLSGITGVSLGTTHTCAVAGGGAWCWGADDQGQLGPGARSNEPLPRSVPGLSSGVLEVAAGSAHTCAIAGSAVRCWGANDAGQLGNGSTAPSAAPVPVFFGEP